jgi:hypothetical protein
VEVGLDVGGRVVGGAMCTLFGGGGTSGTLSGGMEVEDVGVAGVGALPRAGLTAPGGSKTFVGTAELRDPGRNAGSELRIEDSLAPGDPFEMSAK